MSSSNSPSIHRSVSMPAQPQPLQTKPITRSQEKETLVEEDYYPESPNIDKRNKSFSDNPERLGSCTQSAKNIINTEWAGSTIELNNDLRRNEVDTLYNRRKPYRVIEKNGRENVTFKKIPEKSWRYIRDFVTTLVRWILPKRFLTYSTTSNTVNNLPQTPLDCDDVKLTSDTEILEDTVQLNATDENLIKDDSTINTICNEDYNEDDLDNSSSSSKRVIFGLYD